MEQKVCRSSSCGVRASRRMVRGCESEGRQQKRRGVRWKGPRDERRCLSGRGGMMVCGFCGLGIGCGL